MREKEEEDRGRVHESRVAVVAIVPATGGACDENGTPRGAAADESKASGIGVIDREDCGGDGGKGTSPAAAAAEDDGILSLAPPLRPPAYADLVSDPSDLLRIKPDVAAAILASRHRPEGKKPWGRIGMMISRGTMPTTTRRGGIGGGRGRRVLVRSDREIADDCNDRVDVDRWSTRR